MLVGFKLYVNENLYCPPYKYRNRWEYIILVLLLRVMNIMWSGVAYESNLSVSRKWVNCPCLTERKSLRGNSISISNKELRAMSLWTYGFDKMGFLYSRLFLILLVKRYDVIGHIVEVLLIWSALFVFLYLITRV